MLLALSANLIAFLLLYFYLLSRRVRIGEMEEELKRAKLYGAT
jgi:putative effector of murein hydrolase LrgA (UPF0299 family)